MGQASSPTRKSVSQSPSCLQLNRATFCKELYRREAGPDVAGVLLEVSVELMKSSPIGINGSSRVLGHFSAWFKLCRYLESGNVM